MPVVSQARGPAAPAPIGIVYNTSMARPDAAFALGALYVLANRRDARVGAVCVSGSGLAAATYCDIVQRFYAPGATRSSNAVLPIGLAAASPMPPDPPMVAPVIDRRNDAGEPAYARQIQKVTDTSQAEAVLRNGVIMSAESAVVLSAPATSLARTLDLAGTTAQYAQRVKRLVIVDAGAPASDAAALRKIAAEWPAPVFYVGREVGEALALPAGAIGTAFESAPAHPLADAWRAFRSAAHDVPAHDLAAMHFAARPDSGFFGISEPGTLAVSDAGALSFAQGAGNVRRVTPAPAQRDATLAAFLEILGANPAVPAGRGRGD